MTAKCFRCDVSEEHANLYEVIYENEIACVCENCARIENLPVIRKPSKSQLQEAKRPYSVYERLARASGMDDKAEIRRKQLAGKTEEVTLDKLRKPIAFLDEKVKPELKEKLDLIDNFHWEILRARRKAGVTQEQLAKKINVDEKVVKSLEYGQLTDNSPEILKKIENILQINLRNSRRVPVTEVFYTNPEKKERLDDKKELVEQIAKEDKPFSIDNARKTTVGDLKGTRENKSAGRKDWSKITLADLQEMKLREKKQAQEFRMEEIEDWRGKTREEREKDIKQKKEEEKERKEEKDEEESEEDFFKGLEEEELS